MSIIWLLFIALFSFSKGVNSCCGCPDEKFMKTADFIIKKINPENIDKNLRHLTLKQHLAGSPVEKKLGEWVADTWKSQGLDHVHLIPYDVLLSYPIKEKPNHASIIDESGNTVWKSQGKTPGIKSDEEFAEDIQPDFNAYSSNGSLKADIVYANFGRLEDFEKLEELGVEIKGNIVIAKYGKIYRANIADMAEKRGATGVLFYPDPQQNVVKDVEGVYPDVVSLPGTGAPLGTAYLNDGDPLTPLYPSIESAFRIPEDEAMIPKIPVMPLSYNDAYQILSKMGGDDAPSDWQGDFNITYKLGPGLSEEGWQVGMNVSMLTERRTIYDVIGMIEGAVEPDRYVILGNHRDAWIFGGADPSSGTAALLEVTRVLSETRNETGWKPRRSLVFCLWDAEEYGLLGSQEWVENFAAQLVDRAVVYINVDTAVDGNVSLDASSSPLLKQAIQDITKLVPNPNPSEVEAGRTTVFDSWVKNRPDKTDATQPNIDLPGAGSDQKAFQHNYGIPSVDFVYSGNSDTQSNPTPLYHTLYETYYLEAELYDKGFHTHAAIAQIWSLLAVFMADDQIIPFNVNDYASFMKRAQEDLVKQLSGKLDDRQEAIGYFTDALKKFTEAAKKFTASAEAMNTTDALAIRRVNDQMMQVERSFIARTGLPGRSNFNHVVMAPSLVDAYDGVAFSGLTDALAGIESLSPEEQKKQWRIFDEHLAACTYYILSAANTLTEELW